MRVAVTRWENAMTESIQNSDDGIHSQLEAVPIEVIVWEKGTHLFFLLW